MSNTFAPLEDADHWARLVSFIDGLTGGSALVGYDREGALVALSAVGFEPVGALTVWAT